MDLHASCGPAAQRRSVRGNPHHLGEVVLWEENFELVAASVFCRGTPSVEFCRGSCDSTGVSTALLQMCSR